LIKFEKKKKKRGSRESMVKSSATASTTPISQIRTHTYINIVMAEINFYERNKKKKN
jgi:hypothetical protein